MDTEPIHDLTAAYALDALDPAERQVFEEHLAGCRRCQEEVAELSLAAGSLAYAVEPVSPPPQLRARILDAARAERPNVVPLRPRWAAPLAAAAAIAACAVIGLADLERLPAPSSSNDQTSALRGVPLTGATGSVVVGSGGTGALVVAGLDRAPAGKTYEAWVDRGQVGLAGGHVRRRRRHDGA